jgi:hypothetical protein
MKASNYLLRRIARHGAAAQRLSDERRDKRGELATMNEVSAAAFDAADFIWTYFALNDDELLQEDRYVRNRVAEAIICALKETLPASPSDEELMYVFENDGSQLGPNEVDGSLAMIDEKERSDVCGNLEFSIRDTGNPTMLVLNMPEEIRDHFIKRVYGGSAPGEEWPVPITLELSLQPDWITDSGLRTKAKRRNEPVHLRIPLDEIHVSYLRD